MPDKHHSIPSEVDVAKRAIGDMPCANQDSRPLTAAIESVRFEVQRLDAIRELLEYAETDWADQQAKLDRTVAAWEQKRRRLIEHIGRYRARRRVNRGTAPQATGDQPPQSPAADQDLRALRTQLAETLAMLETTRDALRQNEVEHRQQVAEWTAEGKRHSEELDRLRAECQTLRNHAANYASGASPQSKSAPLATGDAMSWEQRKAAMLEQLHREDHENQYSPSEKDSLRDLIAKTDREIHCRDEEIAELRQLLEEQSTTLSTTRCATDGEPLAVGAAAFGHLFDADEMIREEREKAKEIRRQWEEKLRQCEIELSLERAKLARGRRELEQKQADLEEQLFRFSKDKGNVPEAESIAAHLPQRRWLKQLGLGEGS